MLNVIVALSDYEPDMGVTNVVPGSHHFPSPDLAAAPEEAAASIGSALMPMECKGLQRCAGPRTGSEEAALDQLARR